MKVKVLITVMTYPSLSHKYFETVCTAGFREDGSWIRIFPVPHRLLTDQDGNKYKKWQWVEVDLEKNNKDSRPESFHIKDIDTLKIIGDLGKGVNWDLRYKWVKKNKKIYINMSELIDLASKNELSLAILKPKEIIDVTYERIDLQDFFEKREALQKKYKEKRRQLELFNNNIDSDYNYQFKFAEKIPYKFRYKFTTEDNKVREILIEDWEIGMLYRNCLKYCDEKTACEKVRERYLGFAQKDLLFFMGTNYKWHNMKSPNPFLIIGVFYAQRGTFVRGNQLSLFDD